MSVRPYDLGYVTGIQKAAGFLKWLASSSTGFDQETMDRVIGGLMEMTTSAAARLGVTPGQETTVGVGELAMWRNPPTPGMFVFQPEHDGGLPIETAVGQAIGAASMCWETPEHAGVFQEDRARQIHDALMGEINNILGGTQKQPGQRWTPIEDTDQEHVPFLQELAQLINKHSMERHSNTPDWILAQYLVRCLESYAQAVTYRDSHSSRPLKVDQQ